MTDSHAKRALILTMLEAFPSGAYTAGTPTAYADTVEDCSGEAVGLACADFAAGRVPERDQRWAPTAAEFAERARLMDRAIARRDGTAPAIEETKVYRIGESPPEGYVPLGPIEADFGHGRLNLRGLTHAQKEEALRTQRMPETEPKRVGFTPKLQRA